MPFSRQIILYFWLRSDAVKKQRTKEEQLPPQNEAKDYVHQLREENAKRYNAMKAIFDRIDRALNQDKNQKKD